MTNAAKVVWTEGMFLRPHHFQQSESYLLSQVRYWGTAQRPYMWGLLHIEFDEAMLRHGSIALNSASGILPDGTPFYFNSADKAPVPLSIDDNQSGQRVVLALPARRGGREEVIFNEASDSLARYMSFEAETDDCNSMSIGPAVLQFGGLRLRLMLESDLTAEWTAFCIAHVVEKRSDNQLRLNSHYIPPMLNSIANPLLFSYLNDIQGLLEQRSQQIGQRLQQPGRFNNSDMVDFMLLALMNRYVGVTQHLRNLPQLHPEQLFSQWLALAAELTTYTPQRSGEGHELPTYNHDALARCFNELVLILRQRLSLVLEENAIQLPLIERSHGLNIATIPDANMVREFGFVLAVKASVPSDILATHFPAQMKVAPVTKIRDLVQLQLPGIVLRAMASAPPQIPWHAGYSYFQLEKGSELWKEMDKSGAFALHLAGEFPGLDMAFWAVRDASA